jgi:hypothetical protein
MRCRARIGLALLGLTVAAPARVWADPPGSPTPAPAAEPAPTPAKPPHTLGWGLFHWSSKCPECQQARVKARDGVDVPPPPMSPEMTRSSFGGAMAARPWLTAGTARAANGKSKSRQVQSGPVVATGPVMRTDNGNAPGHAVAGGASAPGYAVVGGTVPVAEPAPISMAQARPGGVPAGLSTATALRRGPMDPAVMPSSSAPDPIASPRASRPHVLAHLLGLSELGRRSAEERERRQRESHASTPYGPQTEQVHELPASMVYGR